MVKCIRKCMQDYNQWIEKGIKHTHNFSVECILNEEYIGKNKIGFETSNYYYHVIMCDKCHSFKAIGETNNVSGRILNNLDEYKYLPVIKGYKYNQFYGFNKFDELIFPDNYEWKKK